MKLSHYAQGRDNNFNLIRIVAAMAVLITHSFALAIGSGRAEPFRDSLGMTMGDIAVDVFFITSGFLVTASILTRKSALEFLWARVLRIYPALLVMLFITVFISGVAFTSVSITTYWSSSQTYLYLARCATLLAGVAFNLPGVFEGNPYPNAVNGSLWTMPHEVRMYGILVLVWLGLRSKPEWRLPVFRNTLVAFALAAALYVLAEHLYSHPSSNFPKLFCMFFSGAAFYVLRDHIALNPWVFGMFVIGLISTTGSKHAFFIVYIFAIAYVLFYLAYIPSGPIRKYNKLGDYSYGIYIYAFPVQQSVAALMPGVTVLQMVVISAAITMALAVLSWHFLEKPVLRHKAYLLGRTRRLLALNPWKNASSST